MIFENKNKNEGIKDKKVKKNRKQKNTMKNKNVKIIRIILKIY